jgi:hypothetical protein
MLKFDASIFGGELPVGLSVVGIAVVLPGGDFVDEDLFVGNAAGHRAAWRSCSGCWLVHRVVRHFSPSAPELPS